MDRVERLNLADDCALAGYGLLTLSSILRSEDEDPSEIVIQAILIRARRTARALMLIANALSPKQDEVEQESEQ